MNTNICAKKLDSFLVHALVANPAWSMIEPGRAGSVEAIFRSDYVSSVMLRWRGHGSGTKIKALPTTRGSALLALAYGLSQHPHDQSTSLAHSSHVFS